MFIPVVDQNQHPLMPTTPARARRWITSGKATAFWKGGVFCVRLNIEPSAHERQPIAVGIDPGSKREGYSVLSAAHTYLNLQAEARDGVKDAEQASTRMRRNRRGRQTPCRSPRRNRKQSHRKLPPSTRARWQWKLRLATFLCQLFPVSVFVVEDVAALPKKGKRLTQGAKPTDCTILKLLRWKTRLIPLLPTKQRKEDGKGARAAHVAIPPCPEGTGFPLATSL